MLDQEMKDQLSTLFAPIDKQVTLVFEECDHSDQAVLLQFLKDLSSTHEKIKLSPSGASTKAKIPTFRVDSVALAILNAAGKGKHPRWKYS